jgi:hypothetical protein
MRAGSRKKKPAKTSNERRKRVIKRKLTKKTQQNRFKFESPKFWKELKKGGRKTTQNMKLMRKKRTKRTNAVYDMQNERNSSNGNRTNFQNRNHEKANIKSCQCRIASINIKECLQNKTDETCSKKKTDQLKNQPRKQDLRSHKQKNKLNYTS